MHVLFILRYSVSNLFDTSLSRKFLDPTGVWDIFRNLYSVLVVLVVAIANHNITRPLKFIPVLNRDKEFLLIINQDLLTALRQQKFN